MQLVHVVGGALEDVESVCRKREWNAGPTMNPHGDLGGLIREVAVYVREPAAFYGDCKLQSSPRQPSAPTVGGEY
jgi:hypothetical protein